MVESSAYSQSQRNPHLTRNFRVDEPVRTHTVFSYNQRTRSQGCYHGYQINKGKTQDTLKGSHYEQSMTDARIEAYEDTVTTKAWHDEWEIEPDDFGTPEPLLVLNRRANIDLRNQARQTKSTYLCHWDQGHEPRGVLAQRLAEATRSTEKEQAGICIGNEQDLQRMRVKRAVRNAEVIDLTGDDTVGESKLRNCVGIENVENYPPGTMAQPWEI